MDKRRDPVAGRPVKAENDLAPDVGTVRPILTPNQIMSLVHEYGRCEFEMGRNQIDVEALSKSGRLRDQISEELRRLDERPGQAATEEGWR